MKRFSRAWAKYGWTRYVFSLEVKKLLSYRVDFWTQFFGSVLTELGIAYFLWRSIFDSQGLTQIGGYSFKGLMLYYLLSPGVNRVVRGPDKFGAISGEIYEGGLNRYLVFPISFFGYKYLAHFAGSLVSTFQLIITLAVFVGFFGIPPEASFHLLSFMGGLIACYFASYLMFSLSAVLEFVAFWADNVWSLQVMLRFTASLLGGSLIPLVLFPAWSKPLLAILPFQWLLSFPLRTLMGQVSFKEWCIGIAMTLIWSLVMSLACRSVWRRGTLQYTGVGI